MEIRYNVTGARRKELVKIISDITGARADNQYMPTCNYKIGYFTVTRDGTLCFDDHTDRAENERVLEAVAAAGFECELQDLVEAPAEGEMEDSERDTKGTAETVKADPIMEVMGAADTGASPDNAQQGTALGLTVEIPLDKVAVGNLTRLLDAKGSLIKKALGVDALPIEILEDRASFPWFTELPDTDAVQAYTHFISALCGMSKNAKRVTVTEKAVENEKYAFRCFLLRLGFIGAEYKTERKILLKNLTGSSAFKSGAKKEVPGDEISE